MRKLITLMLIISAVFGAVIEVPAVTQNGQGVKVKLECKILPGSGKIFVSTEPLVGISTQQSEKNAVEAVERYLGIDFKDKDVLFIFHANTTKSIDGGSAGVAMAICVIAEVLNKTPNKYVSVTGAIDSNGNVLPVSGILQKAQAMKEKTVFLIPKGQSTTYTYTKKFYSPSPGVYVEELYPVKVNISEYAKSNWNLSIVEISSLEEASKWFFNETIKPKSFLVIKTLPKFEELPRMSKLAEYEIKRAEKAVKEENTTAKEMLTKALETQEGYDYTKANYAFLALVYSQENTEDVTQVARKLAEEFKKMPTSDPFWRAEAELRLSWALFSTENLAAKKEWLMIAAKMLSMERFGNETIDMNFVKEKANEMIMKAKDVLEEAKMAGVDISNAEKSLNFAIESYSNELYFAALYNAIDSIAWSKASLGENFNISKPYSHEFTEAYRRHAIYLLYMQDRRSAAFSAIRAELREEALGNYPKKPIKFNLPSISWKDLVIIALSAYILFKEFEKKSREEISEKERIILEEAKGEAAKLLGEKLKNKEINQETYEKLIRKLGEL